MIFALVSVVATSEWFLVKSDELLFVPHSRRLFHIIANFLRAFSLKSNLFFSYIIIYYLHQQQVFAFQSPCL